MHGEHYTRNRATARALDDLAAHKGFTPAQPAIAWVLSRGEDIVPVAGISRPARIADNLAALDVTFTPDELDRAFAHGAIVGARYPEAVLKWTAQ